MGCKCSRCLVEGETLEGSLCPLCRTDTELLSAVSDWCGSEEARDLLQWEGEGLTAALEYELFMLTMQKIGEALRPAEGEVESPPLRSGDDERNHHGLLASQ